MYDRKWADVDPEKIPDIIEVPPGPRSKSIHDTASLYMKGYSSQVRNFPVVFESGRGCTLKDVDGNTYLDFSSGIYVTSLGHCHPKVSEAVAMNARNLMNCHDFTTPVKAKLLEKVAGLTKGMLSGIQFYDSGTTAVEAGLRSARAATGKFEFISFHKDFHGKTMGAVSCGITDSTQGMRAPGFFQCPRPNCYRCPFGLKQEGCGFKCAEYIETVIDMETTNQVAAIVLEPIQGWAGCTVPPDGFMKRLRSICDKRNILLFADEVLTCMARTGRMFCMEHWDVIPDITTMGKGFGNGFPITAMLISEKHKDVLEKISASTSYGGNPMACAAALASIEVIEQENLCEWVAYLGDILMKRMEKIRDDHPIVGDVRGKGLLLGIELVKDKESKEAYDEAGKMVYQTAFRKGLSWIPAKNVLRIGPPLIITEKLAIKGMDIIEESIYETEKELGYL